MSAHRFHLLNVFATGAPFSGNALCVFEDGAPMDDARMQALARQMNLAETTFLFPSDRATARVRIFTPTGEMPFAGHPTLGTAHVVRALGRGGDTVTLEMRAGVIPVTAVNDDWTLRANAPTERRLDASRADAAAALGLAEDDVASGPAWIHTGTEQLVLPLASPGAVRACEPDARALERLTATPQGESGVYVWAREDARRVVARFFYVERGAVIEDPGTGSACANLGGWLVLHEGAAAREIAVSQGEQTGRPCSLGLKTGAAGEIFVSGEVVAIGGGELVL